MTGILLIHGAWHGPWYWDDFAARLAGSGHDVRTVRLSGHDQRPGRIWHRVPRYVEDVGRAAAQFAAPPVLVGHSMGGLIAQKHLERNSAPGAVLMASIPVGGAFGAAVRLGRRQPVAMLKANLLLSLKPLVGTPALARDLFFTADTAQAVVDGCYARLQDESYPAFVDLLWLARPRPARVRAPMLVLGAEGDAIISTADVRRTAHAYGTEAEIFPGMGHDMALDEGWDRVADRVDRWVAGIQAT